VRRLSDDGHLVRRAHPDDGRAVLAEITASGRAVVAAATDDLVGADFGLGVLGDDDLAALSELLRPVRRAAGDF
jgi:DNA-binding MarR family transcriptional regulator